MNKLKTVLAEVHAFLDDDVNTDDAIDALMRMVGAGVRDTETYARALDALNKKYNFKDNAEFDTMRKQLQKYMRGEHDSLTALKRLGAEIQREYDFIVGE